MRSIFEAAGLAAEAAETEGLQVELGGTAIGLTESSGGHLAEVVGVVVAAVVLFLAFGSLAASLLPIATALVGVGTAYAGIVLLGHAMTVADFAPMLGMLIGLEFDDTGACARAARRAFEERLIVNWTLHRDTVLRLAPPLVLGDGEMDDALARLARALD